MKNLWKILLPVAAFLAAPVLAANIFDIKFPIAELGNCGSLDECKTYCNDPANASACLSWAKDNGFAGEEPRPAEPRQVEQRTGPGGCSSREECDSFCRKPDNAETCLNFAVKDGKITQEEADLLRQQMGEFKKPEMSPSERRGPNPPQIDIEKAKKLLETEGGPGGCSGFEECDTFCGTPGNEETCMKFAADHGLMSAAEIERAKTMMAAVGPGGCRGRECETYCNNPDHGEECIDFAVKQGFMDSKEAEQAKKFAKLAKEPGPGGCTGKQTCDEFCSQPENGDACFAFAKEHGLVSPDDIQRMEKGKAIRGKLESQGGPGGCQSDVECRSYCEDASHFDECVAFAVNAGMMKPDEARQKLQNFSNAEVQPMQPMMPFNPPVGQENRINARMEQFEQFRQEFERRGEYCSDPAHQAECSRGPQTPGGMPPGDMRPPEGMMPPGGGNGPTMPPPAFQGRPEGVPEYGSFRAPGGRPAPNMPVSPEGVRQFMPPANMQLPGSMTRPPEGAQYNSFMPPLDQYRSMQPPEGMMSPPPGGEPPSGQLIPQVPQSLEQLMQPMMAPAPAPSETAPVSPPTSFLPAARELLSALAGIL